MDDSLAVMPDYHTGQVPPGSPDEGVASEGGDALESGDVDRSSLEVESSILSRRDSGSPSSSTALALAQSVGVGRRRHQQLRYSAAEEGVGDGVGVLEAGHGELENGVLVEPVATDAIGVSEPPVAQDDETGTMYTLQQLGYRPPRLLIRERQALSRYSQCRFLPNFD